MHGVEVFVPLAFFLCVFGIVFFVSRTRALTRERIAKGQAEVQSKMIDKFGSAKEFVEFVQSPGGKEFLHAATERVTREPREKILGTIRTAVMFLFLGMAMFLIASLFDVDTRGFSVAGILLTALGASFLISSFISLKLSRAWGLLPPASPETGSELPGRG